MNVVRIAALVWVLATLPGCSVFGFRTTDVTLAKTIDDSPPIHSVVRHCQYEIRDLNVAWGTQSFWCCPGHPDIADATQSPRHSKPQAGGLSSPRQTFRSVGSNVVESAEVEATYSLPSAPPSPATVDRAYIPFAQGSVRLGPKGRSLAVALVDELSGASRILLRSDVIPGDPEHFAITRAVAVRDELKAAGLNAPVTILHPRPGTERSIEVIAQ